MTNETTAATPCSTTVLCPTCGDTHVATVERQGDRVIGRISCPTGERTVPVSSDAGLYFQLRAKGRDTQIPNDGRVPSPLLTQVAITDHCDCQCPVCYAGSGPQENPSFLSVDEVLRRAREVRQRGTRTMALTGGEPTLHPKLLEMVRKVRSVGVRVHLITNGLRLAREPGLAQALKTAGLSKVRLQLDSLREDTHLRQRGNPFVGEKILAVKRVVQARLRLGTVTTVTTLNLSEVGAIIRFALAFAPRLSTIVFQSASPVGRYDLGPDTLVDKEQILGAILQSGSLPDVSVDDVWPLPHFEPWGMRVHPDCAVNLIGIVRRGGFVPVGRRLDMAGVQARMHREPNRQHWRARNVTPLRHILACTRMDRMGLLLALAGFLSGTGTHGIVVIGVGGFCHRDFIDVERIRGCATAELTARGPISPCLLYSGLADRVYCQRNSPGDVKGGLG